MRETARRRGSGPHETRERAMREGGRRWAIVSAAVVATLVLSVASVGCSSGSSSTGTTLSDHDAFIQQASAICRQMKDQAASLNQTAATLSDQTQLSALLDQNVAILQTALTQLRTLTPDPPYASQVATYLTDLDDLHTRTVGPGHGHAGRRPGERRGQPDPSAAGAEEGQRRRRRARPGRLRHHLIESQPDSACLGLPRPGSARLGLPRPGSAGLGLARPGPSWLSYPLSRVRTCPRSVPCSGAASAEGPAPSGSAVARRATSGTP